MLRSLYTAATGMEAQQLRMDVISNNLANASTTGFKKVRGILQVPKGWTQRVTMRAAGTMPRT